MLTLSLFDDGTILVTKTDDSDENIPAVTYYHMPRVKYNLGYYLSLAFDDFMDEVQKEHRLRL